MSGIKDLRGVTQGPAIVENCYLVPCQKETRGGDCVGGPGRAGGMEEEHLWEESLTSLSSCPPVLLWLPVATSSCKSEARRAQIMQSTRVSVPGHRAQGGRHAKQSLYTSVSFSKKPEMNSSCTWVAQGTPEKNLPLQFF